MVHYSHCDPAIIEYSNILQESPLEILVCPLRMPQPDIVKICSENINNFPGHIDRLILDDFTEAPGLDIIEQIICNVVSQGKIARSNILFVNGGAAESTQQIVSWPTFCNLDGFRTRVYTADAVVPWEARSNIFISLARRPVWYRVALTEEFIKKNLLEHSLISCGSDVFSSQDPWKEVHVSQKLQHYFPMLLDGAMTRDSEHYKHSLDFSNAFINVVSESSHDKFPRWERYINHKFNLPESHHHHTRVFITEKTVKAIAMRQLPIFNTVVGHVHFLRGIGLDMFDDIIDHSYDNEADPDKRIQMVANEVERLYHSGIKFLATIPNIKYRLERNFDCFKQFNERQRALAIQKIKDFLNHGHTTI